MHLPISGIPASGKSTFCRWLEEKFGLPTKGSYHELDIIIVDAGNQGRPPHSAVWLGIESKNTSCVGTCRPCVLFGRVRNRCGRSRIFSAWRCVWYRFCTQTDVEPVSVQSGRLC